MGIGTNILGYSNHKIDQKVIRTVQDGNMSTLNCEEEVQLAEKLVEIHGWADMVRFVRVEVKLIQLQLELLELQL